MLEVFAVLFLLTVIVITVIVAIVVGVFDKKETEELRKEAEAEAKKAKEAEAIEEKERLSFAFSLSLIYITHNKNLAASFDRVGFYYSTLRYPACSFASISELEDKGFIKLVRSARVNYDNNGIYESTTPARYQMTESGIAFLKENHIHWVNRYIKL